jgi:hypothetical protein
MTTASMVGRIALLAAVRSPTPAPWMLDEPITEARSRQSGALPKVYPGTAPPCPDGASPAGEVRGGTVSSMTAARELPQVRPADTARGKPPPMPAWTVYVAWWGLFGMGILKVALL